MAGVPDEHGDLAECARLVDQLQEAGGAVRRCGVAGVRPRPARAERRGFDQDDIRLRPLDDQTSIVWPHRIHHRVVGQRIRRRVREDAGDDRADAWPHLEGHVRDIPACLVRALHAHRTGL